MFISVVTGNMVVGALVVILLLSMRAHGNISVTISSGVIVAIQRKFLSGCVVLLTASDRGHLSHQESMTYLQLKKLLSEQNVPVAASMIHKLNITSLDCRRNLPLIVLLSSDPMVQLRLQEYSKLRTMAGVTWLLFLSVGSLASFFIDMDIPFNCEFLVARQGMTSIHLSEVYRVARGKPLKEFYYGRWTLVSGLFTEKESIFKRRSDLDGIVIKAVTANDPPILTVTETKSGVNVTGFFGLVWRILEQKMNFKTNYTVTKDMTKGEQLRTGECKGMIGKLQCGEVDVALGAFSTGSYPDLPIKFAMPLLYTTYQMFIKKPGGKKTDWNAFLLPFNPRLWFVLLFTIFFMSLYLATFYHIGRRVGNEEAEGPELYTLYDSLLYIFGAFCQQGHDITPRSTSCRLIYITAYLTALVLLAAYSAALISSLTVYQSNLPFSDLDGILKDKRFKMGMIDKSEMYFAFSDTKEKGIFGEVYKKLMATDSNNFPTTAIDGLRRACAIKYAFLAIQESVMPLLNKINCSIVALPYKTYPISLAIAFTSDNPYMEFISYRLRMLRDGGVLHRLRTYNGSFLSNLVTKSNVVSVDLSAVAPLLILLASSVVVSVTVLLLEKGRFALMNNRINAGSRGQRNARRHESTSLQQKNMFFMFPWRLFPQKAFPPFQEWHE